MNINGVTDNPPVGDMAKFVDMDGMPSDHYLFFTCEAAKMLRGASSNPLIERGTRHANVIVLQISFAIHGISIC
jgi:hypothetical protein